MWVALLAGLGLAPRAWAEAPDTGMFAEQAGERGFLYEARSKRPSGARLYVYGTVHVGSEARTPFTRPILRALADSRRLALEADVSSLGGALVQYMRMGMYPAGDSLKAHLPQALYERVERAAARAQLPMASLAQMRVFGVPMLLEVQTAKQLGVDTEHGVDVYLAAWAKQHDLPIVEIEGFTRQFEILAGFPEDALVAQLSETLDEIDSGKAKQKLDELLRAWERGDARYMEGLIREMHRGKSQALFARRMLDERNRGMADRAEALIKEVGATFFAVGAAHLFGEYGLLAELRRRGYSVKPIR